MLPDVQQHVMPFETMVADSAAIPLRPVWMPLQVHQHLHS